MTGYYKGANRGYGVGYSDGGNDVIMYGIALGRVKCEYIKKECKKNECKTAIHPKTKSPFTDLYRGGQTSKRELVGIGTSSGNIEL